MSEILKINNVAIGSIGRIDNILKGNISNVSGIAVPTTSSSTYSSVNSWLFDGVDDYAEASINCPTTAGSVSFWFKFGETTSTDILWNWHYNDGTGGNLNRGYIEAQYMDVSANQSAKDLRFLYYPGKTDPSDGDSSNVAPHAITQMLVSSDNHGSAYSRNKNQYQDFETNPPTTVNNNPSIERFIFNANRLIPSTSHSVQPTAGAEHGWHHFVFTWDTGGSFVGKDPQYPGQNISPTLPHDGTTTNYNGVMKIYMDGTLRNFGQSSSPGYGYQGSHLNINNYHTLQNDNGDAISLNKLRISARGNNGNHVPGNWTDVAAFNTAIDADAVLTMYNNGTPTLLTSNSGNYDYSNNLIGYWKLDETSGTTFADSSGNGNNMTLYNGPTFDSGDAPT